jgi:hypothetical protein
MLEKASYPVEFQIATGYSFGVFDTEYVFKRTGSGPDGKLYWDPNNPSKDETGTQLVEEMDFPLVSVALATDAFYPYDPAKIKPWVDILPTSPLASQITGYLDKRNKETWEPTAPGQLLVSALNKNRVVNKFNLIL